ncbi:MAG: Flp pilus assembly complex ATPase component TadA [Synergistaceae bacterium]|nr:Flp pilus assembly complex ATPase component TadA [Synergistaceae bacterium]MBQ9405022.1 Flp pilus assembly complex ATPase component TadA [Synergistaceae bacterium]MBQ9595186.1 Flp pilus assembly complex ATPase component TadA [Synergistaceae bacterium]
MEEENVFYLERTKIGEILLQYNLITETQLEEALRFQETSDLRLGEILVELEVLNSTQVAEALAVQLELPFIQLDRYQASADAIKLVPKNIAERLHLIPLIIDDEGALLVAMADPLDLPAQDEIRTLTGYDLHVAVSGTDDVNRNISRIYDLTSTLSEALTETEANAADIYTPLAATTATANPDDAPLIELVNNLITNAVRENASDIHVEAYELMCRVRYRVDGALYSPFEYPASLHPTVVSRIKIISGMDIAERRKPQDGRILTIVDNRHIDLRVSSLPTMSGEKIVMRILDRDHSFVALEDLGLDKDDIKTVEKFCETPWGIMLATGPTGSGKSTTLYSMLKKISKPDINIITVEDPVEFFIPGINQVLVNEKAGLTFDVALRSILRQDPDKIMIGEIRDGDTAQIAIRSALTGHFVLSTLHTNDAPSAISRIIDMGIPPFLLSASLSGIMAQRLVRCLCPHCKEEYELDDRTCEQLGIPAKTHVYKAVGCQQCRNGYKGRRGIYEIMVIDDDLREMIIKNENVVDVREMAIKKGMKTLRRAGINAALAGYTSLEEVTSATL